MTIKANDQLVSMVKKAAIGSLMRNLSGKDMLALGAGGGVGVGAYALTRRNRKEPSVTDKIKDTTSKAVSGVNKKLEGLSPLATAGIGFGGGVGLYLLTKYLMNRRNRNKNRNRF